MFSFPANSKSSSLREGFSRSSNSSNSSSTSTSTNKVASIVNDTNHYLTEDQIASDDLNYLGQLAKSHEANIIKLPNISASVPQLKAAIKELQSKGYSIPSYPEEPKNAEDIENLAKWEKLFENHVQFQATRKIKTKKRICVEGKTWGQ